MLTLTLIFGHWILGTRKRNGEENRQTEGRQDQKDQTDRQGRQTKAKSDSFPRNVALSYYMHGV